VSYSLDELLAWTMARQTRPGDVLVVGVATPLAALAGQLARELLHPDLVMVESASVGLPAHDVADPYANHERLSASAVGVFGQNEILDAIQHGRITIQFLSPAQVDGRGRMNASRIRRPDGTVKRFPGSLAIPDVSALVGRLVVYRASHEPRFLVPEVDFVSGAGDRVAAIVTSAAVLERSGEGFRLASVHPGVSVDEAVAGCGFDLDVPASVHETERPPDEALRLVRETLDPHGLRRMEVREGREAALATLEALTS
jgi:acyl CoA:acetate/3-ketoacid CoA transferase beta subunit